LSFRPVSALKRFQFITDNLHGTGDCPDEARFQLNPGLVKTGSIA